MPIEEPHPSASNARNRWLVHAVVLLFCSLAYYGAGRVGLSFATISTMVSPIWPASGVALAVLLRFGIRYWPGIFLASCALNMPSDLPLWAVALIAVGATLEAVIGTYLLRHLAHFEPAMERVSDAVSLGTLGGLLSCAVSASLGSSAMYLSGAIPMAQAQHVWLTWITGDAIGVLIMTPLLLSWSVPSCFSWNTRRVIEMVLLLVSTVMVCWGSFQLPRAPSSIDYPFNIFPFVLWAALRFGPRGASLITVLIAAFAIHGTVGAMDQGGVQAIGLLRDSDAALQTFLTLVAATGLLLGSLTAERRRSLSHLRDSEKRYRLLFESNPQVMWVHDQESKHVLAVNETAVSRLGYSRGVFLQKTLPELFFNPADGRGRLQGLRRLKMASGEKLSVELSEKPIVFDGHEARLVMAEDVSERLRTASELRKSEQRLSLHIRQTAIGVIEWDQDFKIVEWNTAAENIFGYSKDDAMGKSAFELIVPEDSRPDVTSVWQRLVEFKQTVRSINDNTTKEGRRIRCEWFNTPLIGEDNHVIGVASLVQDITERELSQNALRESEARFRSIVDSSPMGIHLFELQDDESLILIGANPASESLFHTETSKVLGKPIEEAFPSFSGTQIPHMYRETAIKGKAWWTDQVAYEDDRIVGAYEVNAFQSVPGKMVAMYLDVTERRRTEEALRLRDKAMDAITQGIIITENRTHSTPISYANPAFMSMTGYEFAELKEQSWRIFISDNNDPAEVAEIDRALERLTSCSVEIRCKSKDDVSFLCSISISPILDHEGMYTHFVWVITDVTALKRLEAQFRQSQKMEAIGRLAGGVAHDFNNLLTAIIGYNDLMLADLEEKDPRVENAREIRKAAERAAALTGQLLAFSRQQPMMPRQMNLNQTILGMHKMLGRLIGEDIRIDTHLDDNVGDVKAESSQIEQVIMNLAINARDAMPVGGTLAIRTSTAHITPRESAYHDDLPPGDYVRLIISDTGTGMDEEVREHLFEPFFTTKEKGKGTGLGLATCYGIINQSGGKIRVYSAPNRGTTFEILLPRIATTEPAEQEAPISLKMRGGNETLLVVEDDTAVRPLTISVLRSLGYTVIEAEHGGQAKQRIEEHQGASIDLLLTDVVMPVMGGKELADWMRRTHPGTKILFTSGYLENALSREDLGFNDSNFLQKPFTPVGLAHKVRALLDSD